MPPSHRLFLFLAMLLAGSIAVHGGLRVPYEDSVVVERSELIVVGRLSRESIQRFEHQDETGATWWEHHATLLVSEVLKGKLSSEEIPIVIHYGLTPGSPRGAEDEIGIFDSGNSVVSFSPFIEDVRVDNLWFLRKRAGIYGNEPGTGKYGVVDPEDVQPSRWRDYFLSYLTPDPEAAVAEYARRNPESSERAKRYLERLEIRSIREIGDPGQRFDKLLPLFQGRGRSDRNWEARAAIIACGPVAGERLKALFVDPKHRELREEIIDMWREMKYRAAAPLLIELLKQHDRFWQRQHLQKDWWNQDIESRKTIRRRMVYGEVYRAVYALRSFQEPRARAVLAATRDRWKVIGKETGNLQIVEECEAALRELPELEGGS